MDSITNKVTSLFSRLSEVNNLPELPKSWIDAINDRVERLADMRKSDNADVRVMGNLMRPDDDVVEVTMHLSVSDPDLAQATMLSMKEPISSVPGFEIKGIEFHTKEPDNEQR